MRDGCEAIYRDDKLDRFGDVQFWKCGRAVVPCTDRCPKHLAEHIEQQRGAIAETEMWLPKAREELQRLEEALEAHDHLAGGT